MSRSESPRPIPPAVREAADRLSARRSLAGALSYPFALLVLGLTADLPKRAPLFFDVSAIAVLALAALRVYLIQRFEPLFQASPRRWRIAFYSAVVLKGLLLGGLAGAVLTSLGPGIQSFFVLILVAVAASLSVILYPHAPRVVCAFVALLVLPVLLSLAGVFGSTRWHLGRWEYLCLATFFLYLLLLGGQLYRDRWTGLLRSHQLAVRTAELEAAQAEAPPGPRRARAAGRPARRGAAQGEPRLPPDLRERSRSHPHLLARAGDRPQRQPPGLRDLRHEPRRVHRPVAGGHLRERRARPPAGRRDHGAGGLLQLRVDPAPQGRQPDVPRDQRFVHRIRGPAGDPQHQPGRHGAPPDRGAAAGQGGGRAGRPGQGAVPGQHEPRDPDADGRGPGPDRAAAQDGSVGAAERLRRADPEARRPRCCG